MADPTPEDVAKIDQNMAVARHYLRSQTAAYASLLELAGSELRAQQRLLETLGLEQPDTVAKLLAVAIADRHAAGKRWAEVTALLGMWESRMSTLEASTSGLEVVRNAAWGAYDVCVKALRQLLDGGV